MRCASLTWLLAARAMAQGDLLALLASQPDLSTLLELINVVPGLAETLSGSSNITIFAPTNAAFDAVARDIPEGVAIESRNESSVAGLLANHVVPGTYPADAITNIPVFVQTMLTTDYFNDVQPFTNTTGGGYIGLVQNQGEINVISGEFTVSRVIQADMKAGEGITIHVIDTTLLFNAPLQLFTANAELIAMNNAIVAARLGNRDGDDTFASPFNEADRTFFVPTNEAFELIGSVVNGAGPDTLQDVLTYHILPDQILFSTELANATVPSLQGNDVQITVTDDGNIFVNEARVVLANVILWNGVAHVIDNVLNPLAELPSPPTLEPDSPASERTAFPEASSTKLLYTTLPPINVQPYSTTALLLQTMALLDTTQPVATATSTSAESATPTDLVSRGDAMRIAVSEGKMTIAMGAGLMGLFGGLAMAL